MSFLTTPDLRQQLALAVRSDGDGGLTTARDVRDFLGLVLDELEAEAAQAASSRFAETMTPDNVRTAYPSAQAALDGAGDYGTANVYALAYGAVRANDPSTTVPGLVFPRTTLTTNLSGLALYTPDANTDLFTFTGGTQVLNANNTTVVTNPVLHQRGLGWTVTASSGVVQDLTIHDLNLVVQGRRTNALMFKDPGRYYYSGNITSLRVPTLATESGDFRWLVQNARGTLLGKGTIVAYGNDPATLTPDLPGVNTGIFLVNTNGTTTWEGSITAYDDVAIYLGYSATLVLRAGVLDARERTVGTGPLFRNVAGTVILENYAVLCRPEDEAIRADTLILRGNSVVVGRLNATHIIDERPAAAAAALPTLEFVFGPGYADSYTATCGPAQAGHYTSQTASNVTDASYVRNDTEALALPFTLAAGDTLTVAIGRTQPSQTAVLSLQAS
jgi:hypothetical protein